MSRRLFWPVVAIASLSLVISVRGQAPGGRRGGQPVTLPEGPGQASVQSTCSQCHSLNLIVNSGGIFHVTGQMSVTRFTRFDAIGSGGPYALGALHTLYGEKLGAEDIARRASAAALHFDVSCGVVRRLEREGAVTPETARPLGDLSRIERGRLARLIELGAIHETASSGYWLDRERYAVYADHQRRIAILAVIAILVALFFVVELAGRP